MIVWGTIVALNGLRHPRASGGRMSKIRNIAAAEYLFLGKVQRELQIAKSALCSARYTYACPLHISLPDVT